MKTERFELRFAPKEKDTIARAANKTKQSIASFVRSAAIASARIVIGAK